MVLLSYVSQSSTAYDIQDFKSEDKTCKSSQVWHVELLDVAPILQLAISGPQIWLESNGINPIVHFEHLRIWPIIGTKNYLNKISLPL